MKYGYVRVGPEESTLELQLKTIKKEGCRKRRIFVDQCPGGTPRSERPQLQEALAAMVKGDTLIIWRLDRVALSVSDLVTLVAGLREQGIALHSVVDKITTKARSGKTTRRLFKALAQFERDVVVERTIPGRKSASDQGRLGGRPLKLTGEKLTLAAELRRQGKNSVKEIAEIVGVSVPTIYRHVRADGSLVRQVQVETPAAAEELPPRAR